MWSISNDCRSIAWALLLTTCKHLRTTAATAAHPCLVVMTSSSVAHVSSALNLLSCLPRRLLGMFQMQSLTLFWYLLSAYLHLSCVSKTIPQATSSMTKCYPSSFMEPRDMFLCLDYCTINLKLTLPKTLKCHFSYNIQVKSKICNVWFSSENKHFRWKQNTSLAHYKLQAKLTS